MSTAAHTPADETATALPSHGVRYLLDPVGEQGRYGVRDTQTGQLVRFRADGRWRRWSSVQRAIEGANTLNGREVYTYNDAGGSPA